MKAILTRRLLCVGVLGLLFVGCATKPYDYTNFRAHRPRSILVLPPLNESTAVEATYSYLSTATFPLAELGYYVFPVAVVDQFLKENGLPTAGEMHQAPLQKVREVIGADAVLYITLKQYGTRYIIFSSTTTVAAEGKLVDTQSGTVLWEGRAVAQEGSGGSGSLIGDLIAAALDQLINSSTDHAHGVCRLANANLFTLKDHGLLYGPHHPKYDQQ
jgi:hypothetical protein